MDADFEDRTAARLRAEIGAAVPDDLIPPPLPGELDDEGAGDVEVVPLRVRSPLWPFAVAAAVALIAVVVTIGVRPDPAAISGATSTSTATPTIAPTSDRTPSPDPNVGWVPMPARAADRAADLLAAWEADGVAPPPVPGSTGIPYVESASVSQSGLLTVSVIGSPLGAGPCDEQLDVAVVESSTAVVVLVAPRPPTADRVDADAAPVTCAAVGHILHLPVPLTEPLGDRDLLDLNRWTAQWGGPVQVPVSAPSSHPSPGGTPPAVPVTDPVGETAASPDPDVFWVPMPASAVEQAKGVLQEWESSDHSPGASTPYDPRTPAGSGPLLSTARVDPDGGLVVAGVGSQPGTGPCQQQHEISVLESASAVVVLVQMRSAPGGAEVQTYCPAIGHEVTLQVPLAGPLGDRAVLDLNQWTGQYGGPLQVPVTH